MPFKLGPDSQPNTPVVSYSMDIANRILVENLTLKIKVSFRPEEEKSHLESWYGDT